MAENPEELIGYCLINKKEAILVRRITDSIDKLLSELGNELTDLEYISCPQWDSVLKASTEAYKLMKTNEVE